MSGGGNEVADCWPGSAFELARESFQAMVRRMTLASGRAGWLLSDTVVAMNVSTPQHVGRSTRRSEVRDGCKRIGGCSGGVRRAVSEGSREGRWWVYGVELWLWLWLWRWRWLLLGRGGGTARSDRERLTPAASKTPTPTTTTTDSGRTQRVLSFAPQTSSGACLHRTLHRAPVRSSDARGSSIVTEHANNIAFNKSTVIILLPWMGHLHQLPRATCKT